jgi:hypothetical protein
MNRKDLIRFSGAEAERLARFYAEAEREILSALNRALLRGNKTEYLAQMKKNVEAILADLRAGNRTWCEEAIPRIYLKGMEFGDGQLQGRGVKLVAGFGAIHQQAAQVLAENTFLRLENVAQVIGRRSEDVYRTLALENIRGSVVGFETWKQVARNLREDLARRGVTGFRDAKNREWNMRSYSEMVARTSTMEAHLQGTANRLLEHGHDLVKVSSHSGACEMCQPWQGKVLSLTGKTQGYPTLEETRAEGLFHPNCRHAYSLSVDLDKEIREAEADLLRKQGKSDIMKTKIDTFIDAQTPCLVERATGNIVNTTYALFKAKELKNLKQQGWNFNWTIPSRKGYDVYGLTLTDSKDLQGLIAIRPNREHLAIEVSIVESAPRNVGSRGQYRGVGGHLFAIAAKMSFKHRFDGYVYFEAKTKLIDHYKKELGAIQVGNSLRMYINTENAQVLVKKYFGGEANVK